MKWLGTSEKLYNLFFTLLKGKKQRELMHSLLMDNDICIVDEAKILREVFNFYKKLFQLIGNNETIQEAK